MELRRTDMFNKIKRDDNIFKSELFLQDAIAFNVMISIIENIVRYPTPKIFSNGRDCIIVNSDPEHPVIVWTADSFKDYEGVFHFVDSEFKNNNPFKIMSKMELYNFLNARNKVDNSNKKILGAYQCKNLNDIEYVGRADNITREEISVVAGLIALFGKETGENVGTEENIVSDAESFINNPLNKVWRDTNNKIVALARIRITEKYARTGLVITDVNERGKSYAKMLVHFLAQHAMNIGKTPVIFTDFDYVPSNKCYKAVGYELRSTLANYELKKPQSVD